MEDNRYVTRRHPDHTWSVLDSATGDAAETCDFTMVRLTQELAEELADLLNVDPRYRDPEDQRHARPPRPTSAAHGPPSVR